MSRGKPKPEQRYLDEFVRLSCSADLIALKVFPNAKEITESFAAYNAVRSLRPRPDLRDRTVVVDVGAGHHPRTACTFAFRSRWRAVAVDPLMRARWVARGPIRVDRLTCIRDRIENVVIDRQPGEDTAIIVAVHSHAPLEAAVASCKAFDRIIVVAIECCRDQTLDVPPDYSYDDDGIWSPKRTVQVWRDVA